MEEFIGLSALRPSEEGSNGFVMTEVLAVLCIAVILLAAFLPVLVQSAQRFRSGEAWEELSRQGMIMDETVYGVLRFSSNTVVSETMITCRDEQNMKTGFRIKNSRVYRILSNGSEQPLTGSQNTISIEDRISVKPYENRPYFSVNGQTIQVAIILYDRSSRQEWPCIMKVVPLSAEWGEEGL